MAAFHQIKTMGMLASSLNAEGVGCCMKNAKIAAGGNASHKMFNVVLYTRAHKGKVLY